MSNVKLGQLFIELAEKAGIESTDERLKEVAGIGIEVPAELASELQSKLMSYDAAINNDSIIEKAKKKFTPGFEQSIYESLETLGLMSKEAINELKKPDMATGAKLKASYAKLAEKIKALQEAKGDGSSQQEIAEIKRQHKEALADVERLNNELVARQNAYEHEKVQTVLEAKKDSLISKIDWADHFDPSIRKAVFDVALNQKLQEIGGALIVENNQLFLRKSSDTQSDLYDGQNRKVSIEGLVNLITQEKGFARAGTGKPSTPNSGASPLPPQKATSPTKAQSINQQTLGSILR